MGSARRCGVWSVWCDAARWRGAAQSRRRLGWQGGCNGEAPWSFEALVRWGMADGGQLGVMGNAGAGAFE